VSDMYPRRMRIPGKSGETGGVIALLEQGKLVVSSDSDSDADAEMSIFSQ